METIASMDRRQFLKSTAACAGAFAALTVPDMAFATVPGTRKKLIVIELAGGVDSFFTFAVPYNETAYRQLRPNIYLKRPGEAANRDVFGWGDVGGVIHLADTSGSNIPMGMHPNAVELASMFAARELQVYHTTNLHQWQGQVELSHFDEASRMYNGMNIRGASDQNRGWMNRLLGLFGGQTTSPGALAITNETALHPILRGDAAVGMINSGTGNNTNASMTDRLRTILGSQGIISNLLQQGLQNQNNIVSMLEGHNTSNFNSPVSGFLTQCGVAATLLTGNSTTAPSMAVLKLPGWDFHAMNFHAHSLVRTLSLGINTIVTTLKAAGMFQDTMIVVMSEFGRAVAQNTSGGTDHGTHQAALIITGNPALQFASASEGLVGTYNGLGSRNSMNHIMPTSNFMVTLRDRIGIHYGLSDAQKQLMMPLLSA